MKKFIIILIIILCLSLLGLGTLLFVSNQKVKESAGSVAKALPTCSENKDCRTDNCVSNLAREGQGLCCPIGYDCIVHDQCRKSMPKICEAKDARDADISGLGDAIDANWCVYNEINDCKYINSGLKKIDGKQAPDFWEEVRNSSDSDSASILYGEKIVYIGDISKYIIKAQIMTKETAHFYINDKEVLGLHNQADEFINQGEWIDVTEYFITGDNLLNFTAYSKFSYSKQRYLDINWNVSSKGLSDEMPYFLNVSQNFCNFRGVPQVASGLSVIFSWVYTDFLGGKGNAYEIWLDDESNFNGAKFEHTYSGSSSSYSFALADDDNSDYISSLQWNTIYYWKLRIKDRAGKWSEWSETNSFITPLHKYPYVNFSWFPYKIWAKDKTQFCSTKQGKCSVVSQARLSDFFGDSVFVEWDFGDGKIIKQNNPIYIFPEKGDYNVKVKVTDEDGYSCVFERTINSARAVPNKVY
jgi:hypothetical protein